MIKMNLLLTRRAGLTFEEFSDYWTHKHWPKIRDETPATRLAVGYAQQHRVDGVPAGILEAPYDGIVEAWWPDRAAMYAAMGSAQWSEILRDEENFIDRSKTLMLLTEQAVRWEP